MGVLDGFGEAMRHLRERSGFASQGSLADASGVSLGTVNKLETGRRLPDFQTIEALLGAMKADLPTLADELLRVQRGNGAAGGPSQPDPQMVRWIAWTLRERVDAEAILAALGIGSSSDPQAGAARASFVEAAREIVAAAFEELDNARRHREIAEEIRAEMPELERHGASADWVAEATEAEIQQLNRQTESNRRRRARRGPEPKKPRGSR